MKEKNDWIFYLNLTESIPSFTYSLSSNLNQFDLTMLPVNMRDLMQLTRDTKKFHLIIAITSFKHLEMYNRFVKKILKYLIKYQRVNLILLSSFDDVNVDMTFTRSTNYSLIKLPISVSEASYKVVEKVDSRLLKEYA